MNAYSKDLDQKLFQAVEECGRSMPEATRLFSISLSSLKRYTKLVSE